jgi:hypothetical protein
MKLKLVCDVQVKILELMSNIEIAMVYRNVCKEWRNLSDHILKKRNKIGTGFNMTLRIQKFIGESSLVAFKTAMIENGCYISGSLVLECINSYNYDTDMDIFCCQYERYFECAFKKYLMKSGIVKEYKSGRLYHDSYSVDDIITVTGKKIQLVHNKVPLKNAFTNTEMIRSIVSYFHSTVVMNYYDPSNDSIYSVSPRLLLEKKNIVRSKSSLSCNLLYADSDYINNRNSRETFLGKNANIYNDGGFVMEKVVLKYIDRGYKTTRWIRYPRIRQDRTSTFDDIFTLYQRVSVNGIFKLSTLLKKNTV